MKEFDKMIDGLKQDVKVPDNIWKTYINTLEALPEKENKIERENLMSGTRFGAYKIALIAAVIIILGAGAVFAATHFDWNRGLETSMGVDDVQKEAAERSGLADFPAGATKDDEEEAHPSVTEQGITITAEQTIVDNYSAMIALSISGLKLDDMEQEPSIGDLDITIGGKNYSWSGGFYDGWYDDGYGNAINDDGVYMADLPDGELGKEWLDENGNYTYLIGLNNDGERGELFGKEISVEVKDIGISPGKTEHETLIEGTWSIKWQLKGTSSSKVIKMNETLGDSGAVVKEIEISPISFRALYDFPRSTHEEPVVDVDGSMTTRDVYDDPPALMGVKLKDGTLLPNISNGGSLGYTDLTGAEYEERFATSRILDVDEIAAILFLKESPKDEEKLTEENFYVVPIE